MFHTYNIAMAFGTIAIAVVLLFASGGNQQALVANLCGSGFCDPGSGISYPSPHSHFFGGDVLHHHVITHLHHHGGNNHH